jgi:hypothetical protein
MFECARTARHVPNRACTDPGNGRVDTQYIVLEMEAQWPLVLRRGAQIQAHCTFLLLSTVMPTPRVPILPPSASVRILRVIPQMTARVRALREMRIEPSGRADPLDPMGVGDAGDFPSGSSYSRK